MAERRMFAKTIIDSDAFLDMPLSTQALYFHLSMRADDEGFINNPKKIQRMVGCNDDDIKLLIAKRFILVFESGVIVIKHWKIHNYIRNDRFKQTLYQEEREMLDLKENNSYQMKETPINQPFEEPLPLGIPDDNQPVYQMDTQVRLGKVRLGKDSIYDNNRHPSELIQNLYGMFPSGILQSALVGWLDEWSVEMVSSAIQSAYDNGCELRGLKPYVSKILSNWQRAGIDTLEKVNAENERFLKQKNASISKRNKTARKEILPDWAREDYDYRAAEEEKQKKVGVNDGELPEINLDDELPI